MQQNNGTVSIKNTYLVLTKSRYSNNKKCCFVKKG